MTCIACRGVRAVGSDVWDDAATYYLRIYGMRGSKNRLSTELSQGGLQTNRLQGSLSLMCTCQIV